MKSIDTIIQEEIQHLIEQEYRRNPRLFRGPPRYAATTEEAAEEAPAEEAAETVIDIPPAEFVASREGEGEPYTVTGPSEEDIKTKVQRAMTPKRRPPFTKEKTQPRRRLGDPEPEPVTPKVTPPEPATPEVTPAAVKAVTKADQPPQPAATAVKAATKQTPTPVQKTKRSSLKGEIRGDVNTGKRAFYPAGGGDPIDVTNIEPKESLSDYVEKHGGQFGRLHYNAAKNRAISHHVLQTLEKRNAGESESAYEETSKETRGDTTIEDEFVRHPDGTVSKKYTKTRRSGNLEESVHNIIKEEVEHHLLEQTKQETSMGRTRPAPVKITEPYCIPKPYGKQCFLPPSAIKDVAPMTDEERAESDREALLDAIKSGYFNEDELRKIQTNLEGFGVPEVDFSPPPDMPPPDDFTDLLNVADLARTRNKAEPRPPPKETPGLKAVFGRGGGFTLMPTRVPD